MKTVEIGIMIFFTLTILSMFRRQGVWYSQIPLKYKLRPGCSLLDSLWEQADISL